MVASKIAAYGRVSTDEQSLLRQQKAISEYVEREFGANLNDVEFYRDKSTGTDTERSGYQSLMDDAHNYDAVVVKSITRISRNIRDLEDTADNFESTGTELHIIAESLVIKPGSDDPFQEAVFQLLGVFSELEAKMTQQRVREGLQARMDEDDYHHGPAPIGFEKQNGKLYASDNHDRVVTVLQMVNDGDLSQNKASKELGVARSTIARAIENRPELYGLESHEPQPEERVEDRVDELANEIEEMKQEIEN